MEVGVGMGIGVVVVGVSENRSGDLNVAVCFTVLEKEVASSGLT